jgi:hypothetical protein
LLCLLLSHRSMIEGSTRISSGMAIKQLASRGSKGAGGASRTLLLLLRELCAMRVWAVRKLRA